MLPNIPTITAYTPQGKALVAILHGLLYGVHIWHGKKWQRPPLYFHEDPRLFTKKDLLFFAYKYYFKPPLQSDDTEGVENFFLQNPPIFSSKENIISEVTLTAAGDLMPYEWIQKRFCPHLWEDIADDFFSSDLTFANLETPIDISKPASLVPEVMLSDMNFNGDEEMFDLFQATGDRQQETGDRQQITDNRIGNCQETKIDRSKVGTYLDKTKIDRSKVETYLHKIKIDRSKVGTYLDKIKIDRSKVGTYLDKTKIDRSKVETYLDKTKIDRSKVGTYLDKTKIDRSKVGTYRHETKVEQTEVKRGRQGANQRGFDILSTANNHSLDMGESGVFKTIEYLNSKNIAFTGTARTAEERDNFPIIERNGIKIAFIAYTFSMNQHINPDDKPFLVNHLEVNQPDIDLSPIKRIVLLAKERKAEFVVLSLHFSNAYQAYPNVHIIKNAQRIFDECGVDVILGGHAHNVQPMAQYNFVCPFNQQKKSGLILFSFSDFIAYDIFNGCHLSVYLKLKIGRNTEGGVFLTNVKAIPVYACGVYENKNKRDLRLLNAEKWLAKIEKEGKPDFMTDWNVRELKSLMCFYNQYFNKNLITKVE